MAETNEDVEDTPEQWTAKQAAIALLPALPTTEEEPPTEAPFVVTKEYRRIAEFADAVRRERYIGLYYGPPGIGQTLSARRYARWDLVEPAVQHFKFFHPHNVPREILDTRSAVYTPKVHNSPGRLDKELAFVQDRLSWAIQTLEHPEHEPPDLTRHQGRYAELLIVDEADQLKTPTLEQLRDRHDRTGVDDATSWLTTWSERYMLRASTKDTAKNLEVATTLARAARIVWCVYAHLPAAKAAS